jgi:hypothetical protein
MSLLFIICTIGFFMMLGSFFPNHRRTHFPHNPQMYNNAFYHQQQPNPYYQHPFMPPMEQPNASASPLLYTLIFMALLTAFMYLMA